MSSTGQKISIVTGPDRKSNFTSYTEKSEETKHRSQKMRTPTAFYKSPSTQGAMQF